jgi:hypothetical protein
MNTFTKWLLGIVTIVLFPFTLIILSLYAIFVRVPIWLGDCMIEWWINLKEKLNEDKSTKRD